MSTGELLKAVSSVFANQSRQTNQVSSLPTGYPQFAHAHKVPPREPMLYTPMAWAFNSPSTPCLCFAVQVGELLQLLPNLPPAGMLQATCIRTVGTYSNWLSKHPELLPSLLQFVSSGLTVPSCASAASQAMKGPLRRHWLLSALWPATLPAPSRPAR